MKKALVFKNKICQINDQEFPVAQPLYWVDCPDNITTQYMYDGEQFVSPEDENMLADAWNQLRAERNGLLRSSDWTQLPDVDLAEQKQAWINYRQALRELPNNTIDPLNPVWPTRPI